MFNKLQVRLQRPEVLPNRAFPTDAGLDLRSKVEVILCKGERTLVGTGVQVRIPEGYVGLLLPRSSLSKKYILMTNSCGVIDSQYRGEIMASLLYHGETDWCIINKDERIVQLLIVPIALPSLEVVSETDALWNDTSRGTGGFGSTGSV